VPRDNADAGREGFKQIKINTHERRQKTTTNAVHTFVPCLISEYAASKAKTTRATTLLHDARLPELLVVADVRSMQVFFINKLQNRAVL
jgi:hypothetical protein